VTEPIAGRFEPTRLIGVFNTESRCDHPSATRIGDRCRCIVCPRCYKHTGNAHQGHFWALCKLTKTLREFHLCCPGNCELGPEEEQ
jgi:hypothetical protein